MADQKDAALFPARGTSEEVEEGKTFQPKFNDQGLIPCITQDAESHEVLMFAFMNNEALARTLETGEAHYYSRSRQKLWRKGEKSGHTQKVRSIRTDCDQDTILLRVTSAAGACHVGYRSCFYRELDSRDQAVSPQLRFIGGEKAFDPAQTYQNR